MVYSKEVSFRKNDPILVEKLRSGKDYRIEWQRRISVARVVNVWL